MMKRMFDARMRCAGLVILLLAVWPVSAIAAVTVSVRVQDPEAKGISGVEVQYHQDAWKKVGKTDAQGEITIDLEPGRYIFRAIHNGVKSRINHDIRKEPQVVFRTVPVTIRAVDSQGKAIAGGTARYFGSGWQTIGTTNDQGEVVTELLLGKHPFQMEIAGAVTRINHDIRKEPQVVFRTVPVTIRAVDGAGKGIAGGTAQYFGSGWQTIGTTDDNGEVATELLLGKYPFRMEVAGAVTRINHDIRKDPKVVFRIAPSTAKGN